MRTAKAASSPSARKGVPYGTGELLTSALGHQAADRLLLTALGVSAGATLTFEIAVTRLFSLFFQYHYAYLALSLAVLGVSLGAALAYLVLPTARANPLRWLARLLVWQALLFISAAFIMPWLSTPLLGALAALPPFLVSGIFSVGLFTLYAPQSGSLYGADLAGAGVGVFVALLLLGVTSPTNIVLLLALCVALVAWRLEATSGASGWYSAAIAVISIGLLLLNLVTGWLDYSPGRVANPPRDKTMLTLLRSAGDNGRIVHTEWSPFARVDVVETADPNRKFVFTNGGAGSLMTRFDGDLQSVADLRNLPDYAPFALAAPKRPLILGAGAGKDILMALLSEAQEITALEVNPAVATATRAFGSFNGHILDHPSVQLHIGDARTFVERSPEQYDLIYLNLVYTQVADLSGQAQVENYVFTTQAFQGYLRHLLPGGQVALITHNALEGSRAALTALAALAEMGTPPAQALDQLALWMLPDADPTLRTSVLLISQSPFTPEQLMQMTAIMQQRNMQPLFVPGQFEMAFEPLRRGGSIGDFVVDDAAYDLSPTTDNSPFFFKLDHGIPAPVRQALMPALLLAALFLLLAGGMRLHSGAYGGWWQGVVQSLLLGAGFMLFEISLIQRLQLLLGYPVWSLATVLGSLLLAGGAGSWYSQRWSDAHLSRRMTRVAAGVALLMLLYWLLLPTLVRLLLPTVLSIRLLAAAALTALVGFGLGQLYPSLLRRTSQHLLAAEPAAIQQRGLAVLWGLNGAMAVVGSTLAVMLAMNWGFDAAMVSGAACYGAFCGLNLLQMYETR